MYSNSFPTSTRRTPALILLCLFALFLPATALASQGYSNNGSVSIEQRYNEAKFYYNQLESSRSLAADRGNWLKGAGNFRQIYLAAPTSAYAPACLFMLGRLQHSMYERFKNREDLAESISFYEDTARLFPTNRLADDSYFAIGEIYLKRLNDPGNAARYFTKIINEYPSGDMHPLAADLLQQLSRDHDIPLPNVMVDNPQLSDLSYVLPVKYWSSKDYTRIVIMASNPVKFEEQLLEETKDQPRRLYIDFHSSYIEPKYRAPVPIEDGLLKRIRTGQFSKDTVRVVLDIESIDNYEIYSLPEPFRVVIDVRGRPARQELVLSKPKRLPPKPGDTISPAPSSPKQNSIVVLRDQKKIAKEGLEKREEFHAETMPVPVVPQQGPELSLVQQLGLGIKSIVLDPGHGGKDPGAIANGLKEKNIVLDLARLLQPILAEDLDCEVHLTREDDTFLSLEERTAIANTKSADLFISLHINAHPSPDVRGIETYFLNLSTNAEAMRVAAMENATSTHQMSDLQDILSDIMKNSKIKESSRLAQQVHQSIISGLAEQSFGEIKNLGVKQAPFYVLIGAQMPAILIEISFISNPTDAENLRSPQFLNSLAQQISQGIRSYMNANTAGLQLR